MLPCDAHRVVREENSGSVAQREEIVPVVLGCGLPGSEVCLLLKRTQLGSSSLDERSGHLLSRRIGCQALNEASTAHIDAKLEYIRTQSMAVERREGEELFERRDAWLAVGSARDEWRLRREEGAGAEELATQRAGREADIRVRDDVHGAHVLDRQELHLADSGTLGAKRSADIGALAVAADDVLWVAIKIFVGKKRDDAEAREHGRLHEAVTVVFREGEAAQVLRRELGGAHDGVSACVLGGEWQSERRLASGARQLELAPRRRVRSADSHSRRMQRSRRITHSAVVTSTASCDPDTIHSFKTTIG